MWGLAFISIFFLVLANYNWNRIDSAIVMDLKKPALSGQSIKIKHDEVWGNNGFLCVHSIYHWDNRWSVPIRATYGTINPYFRPRFIRAIVKTRRTVAETYWFVDLLIRPPLGSTIQFLPPSPTFTLIFSFAFRWVNGQVQLTLKGLRSYKSCYQLRLMSSGRFRVSSF